MMGTLYSDANALAAIADALFTFNMIMLVLGSEASRRNRLAAFTALVSSSRMSSTNFLPGRPWFFTQALRPSNVSWVGAANARVTEATMPRWNSGSWEIAIGAVAISATMSAAQKHGARAFTFMVPSPF